jgi:hypothetical protein
MFIRQNLLTLLGLAVFPTSLVGWRVDAWRYQNQPVVVCWREHFFQEISVTQMAMETSAIALAKVRVHAVSLDLA